MRTVLGCDVILFSEILDFARHADCQAGGIEARDRPHAADTLARGAPEGFGSNAVGTHCADSGNDHAAFHGEVRSQSVGAEPTRDSVSIRGFLTCKGTSCKGESIGGNPSGPFLACSAESKRASWAES